MRRKNSCGLGRRQDVVGDRLVEPREEAQAGHEVRVVEEPHVEHQVGVDRACRT